MAGDERRLQSTAEASSPLAHTFVEDAMICKPVASAGCKGSVQSLSCQKEVILRSWLLGELTLMTNV